MQVSRFRLEGPLPCPTFFTHMKTCFWLSAPAGAAGGGGERAGLPSGGYTGWICLVNTGR